MPYQLSFISMAMMEGKLGMRYYMALQMGELGLFV
jgi:hypothetical protein